MDKCVSACKSNDYHTLTTCINDVENIDMICDSGYTLLHLCCLSGFEEGVHHLFQCGASLHTKTSYRDTALHLACMYQKGKIIDFLLDNGADADVYNGCDEIPLHIMAKTQLYDQFKNVCDATTNINSKNSLNQTPLHVVCQVNTHNCSTYFADILLNNGAKVDVKDCNMNTPLHLACKHNCGDVELLDVLLSNDASTNFCNVRYNTPLHLALSDYVSVDDYEFIKKLATVTNNYEPNRELDTPLQLAMKYIPQTVYTIAPKTSDINYTNSKGKNATLILVQHWKTCEYELAYLIQLGGDLFAKDSSGVCAFDHILTHNMTKYLETVAHCVSHRVTQYESLTLVQQMLLDHTRASKRKRSSDHDDVCAICMDSIQTASSTYEQSCNCCHTFHTHCILKWIHSVPSCPECRVPWCMKDTKYTTE